MGDDMIKATTNTYYTTVEETMQHIDEMVRIIKSNSKYYKMSSKPFQCKRYNFNEDEIGTRSKLIEELKWWISDGWFVSEIKATWSNQVRIEIKKVSWFKVDQWV